MIERVISGGQSGVDLAGWLAATAVGIPTGGAMPRGFLTEDGPTPAYAELYGAREMPTTDYPARTRQNVADSDVTLWFGDGSSPGGMATFRAARELGKPILGVYRGMRPSQVAAVIRVKGWRVINVAGSRASKDPELGDRVERFLVDLFRQVNKG